ncbi:hypothetical protein chiPu_0000338 [Chiloscyllium punctatum]|uniref:Uncharacterized protein n=1 Tax=Chiloscyllium punctatum TaxID=137246 RepID=A0A401RUX3_CHIPU|nr:hypothetical protein [Chiloscyllium punctatum]
MPLADPPVSADVAPFLLAWPSIDQDVTTRPIGARALPSTHGCPLALPPARQRIPASHCDGRPPGKRMIHESRPLLLRP